MAEPTLLAPESAVEAEVFAMPATPGQVRFWSLDRLNPGNPALNMPLMWQCSGPLDRGLLTAAFARCMARHESLRTTFSLVDGRLAQILHPVMELPIPLDDLTALAGEDQRLEADRITREHAALRFDLQTGPPLALRLLRLAPGSHLLLVTMHHIICDGISNGILLRDMLAFYRAGLRDPHGMADAALPELPIQFADYAVWQQGWSEGPDHEASLRFWRETLGSGFTPMRLPRDPDAPGLLPLHRTGATGDIQTLLIPPDLQARAHSFCARAGVTLNVLLFSTFCTLLARLTGSCDLTVGSPCANRTEDTENLIGLFMNIQVLRVRLQEHSPFTDVLDQVRRWTLAATDHQELPFEDILHDPFFAPSRGQEGTAPIEIPVFFLYQKSFMVTERIESPAGTLTVTPLRSESPGAVFEVMFAIVDREEEGPRLQLEYNPQFFTAATVQAQLRLFLSVLDAVLRSPDQPIRTLPLLSPSAREATLARGTGPAIDFGPFRAVSSAILDQAESEPDRPAVTCAGETILYGELGSRARRLAETLGSRRVRPGDLVGICATRSVDMVVAVLGVLLAGAAYLPLDPRHPPERLRAILADSGAQLVLTNFDLPLPAGVDCLRLDRGEGHAPGSQAPLPEPAGDSLAYVIYTSGSTGQPKGVAIEHAALRNLLLSMGREPGLTRDDVLLAITTLAFDIATLELLLPLLSGARIVLATDEEAQSPVLLLDLLGGSGATVMQATPGAWRSLIDQGWAPSPQAGPPLRILCGGDALSRDLADLLLDRSPSVWNMYGPTETTIWSSATRVTRTAAAPHVGPPIANTRFHVLDSALEPLPAGLTGELYIGGAGLARGYWRKPDRTAASFIPNPFHPASAGHPARLYRTGDCARAFPDGTLQLLGRADFQVKVRGYRIELGEIEAALRRDPAVREAVVVQHRTPDLPAGPDHPATPGVNRLVAYVAAGDQARPESAPALVARLEAELGRTLPEYMLPNVILALEALPRNGNGKIDRRALPDPFTAAGDDGLLATSSGLHFATPRDILERQLAELWQSTLGIDRISIHASFFSLGVGSLAALRLITRMNRLYSMDLGLASLISASSIESVAELIRNRLAANTGSTLVPLKTSGSRAPLFLVHGVGGNVLNFVGLSTRIDPAQPVYAFQAQSLLAGQPALLQLEDMAACYLAEIRRLQPHGPYHLLGYSFGGFLVLEMAHQLRAAGEEVALLGMLDSRSKAYEEHHRAALSVGDRIDRRVRRARGNTESLPASQRLGYLLDKVRTRALRLSSAVAANAHVRQLPAALKSAYDINYVALNRYQVRPFDGRMTLFRAAEQEFPDGAPDLGWSPVFTGGVEIHNIAGDHERIFLEPSIDQLAAAIRTALTQPS